MDSSVQLSQWKSTAKLPIWSKLYDSLALCSPLLWWRCASFKRIQLQPIFRSVAAVGIPPIVFAILDSEQRQTVVSSRWAPGVIMKMAYASWSFAWIYAASSTVSQLVMTIREFACSRSLAKSSAWECLASRILSQRAYRTSTYDVFLPSTTDATKTVLPRDTVPILFFPGASVEHSAYAEPAALLSDRGYLVVVVSASPVNLVDVWLPRFWPLSVRMLQRAVERRHFRPHRRPERWVLMGHSMGSFFCTKLAARWSTTTRGIVMWAAAPFLEFVEEHMPDDVPTLVVQGTNDVVVQTFATPEADKEFWRRLPSNTVRHDIVDGTHSGFASYTSNWKPEVDGIPQAEQHQQAVQATDNFLRGQE